jgi:hypothetical protein
MKYIRPEQEHSGEAHTAKPGALSPLRSGGIYPSMIFEGISAPGEPGRERRNHDLLINNN